MKFTPGEDQHSSTLFCSCCNQTFETFFPTFQIFIIKFSNVTWLQECSGWHQKLIMLDVIMFNFGLMFVSWKVEVEAGKTVLVHTWGLASLWWRVLRGGPRVLWPCPNSAGPPSGVLEVEAGPAQPEEGEEVTEVTIFCSYFDIHLPLFPPVLTNQITFMPCLFFCLSLSWASISRQSTQLFKEEYLSLLWHSLS